MSPRDVFQSLTVLGLFLLNVNACENPYERFECGIEIDGQVTACDKPNEVCLCGEGERRCIQVDRTCDSGYGYSGIGTCVKGSSLGVTVTASIDEPEAGLCPEVSTRPDVPEQCGFREEQSPVSCAGEEVCVCSGDKKGICAQADPSCASGFATSDCLPIASGFVRPIVPNSLCGDSSPSFQPCGTPDESGRLQTCADGELCVCSDGVGACAKPAPEVANECGIPWVLESNGAKACPPKDSVRIADGVCPGAPDPSAVSCGTSNDEGELDTCREGEMCVCSGWGDASGATGACVTSEPKCASGYKGVHDHACAQQSEDNAFVVVAPNKLCPLAEPKPVACSSADGGDSCSGLAGCLCRETDACVEDAPSCRSRLAYSGNGRCVASDDLGRVVPTDDACGGGGAKGDGQ